MRRMAMVAATLVVAGQATHAQSIEMMIPNCRQAESYCAAYIDGVQMMMQVNCQTGSRPEWAIGWFPSNEAGRRVFIDWAEKNESKRNEPFFSGVVSALSEAFPCR